MNTNQSQTVWHVAVHRDTGVPTLIRQDRAEFNDSGFPSELYEIVPAVPAAVVLDALRRIADESRYLAKSCEPAPHACPACEILYLSEEAIANLTVAMATESNE